MIFTLIFEQGTGANAYENMIVNNLHNNMQYCKVICVMYFILSLINIPILSVHFPWYFAVYHVCLYTFSAYISSVWFWRKYLYIMPEKKISVVV